eukprot:scaffold123554_cov17-Tisochrysis_lutea.AAC.1
MSCRILVQTIQVVQGNEQQPRRGSDWTDLGLGTMGAATHSWFPHSISCPWINKRSCWESGRPVSFQYLFAVVCVRESWAEKEMMRKGVGRESARASRTTGAACCQ